MNHQAITVSDEEVQARAPITAFDDKLRRALSDPSQYIIIYLHPILGCGIELLEWLENWQDKFQKLKKKFFIVPGNVNQLECLEVSHPDQALRYVANADEMEVILSSLPVAVSTPAAEAIPVFEPPPKPVKPVTQEPPAKAPAPAEPVVAEEEPPPPKPPVLMDVGMMVETSGEYICTSCKTTRMWLKGDITTECTNPECPEPDTGWEMTYELF
jgi:hypothetical protein